MAKASRFLENFTSALVGCLLGAPCFQNLVQLSILFLGGTRWRSDRNPSLCGQLAYRRPVTARNCRCELLTNKSSFGSAIVGAGIERAHCQRAAREQFTRGAIPSRLALGGLPGTQPSCRRRPSDESRARQACRAGCRHPLYPGWLRSDHRHDRFARSAWVRIRLRCLPVLGRHHLGRHIATRQGHGGRASVVGHRQSQSAFAVVVHRRPLDHTEF